MKVEDGKAHLSITETAAETTTQERVYQKPVRDVDEM